MHPAGFAQKIFAAPDDDAGVDEARAYIKARGYTSDDVRLVRIEEMIVVKLKRDMVVR